MYRIIAYLKESNKTVGYAVSDGLGFCRISKQNLVQKMRNGLEIENAYIRRNIVVLKSKRGVRTVDAHSNTISIVRDLSQAEKNIDAIFNTKYRREYLDDTALKIIKMVDNAVPLNGVKRYGRFKTKYGVTELRNLSTGCKTALLVYLSQKTKQKIVYSMNSAGLNAIYVICDFLSKCKEQYPVLGFSCLPFMYNNELECFLFEDKQCNLSGCFLDIILKQDYNVSMNNCDVKGDLK